MSGKNLLVLILALMALVAMMAPVSERYRSNNIANEQFSIAQDILRPDIYEWGIDGEVEFGSQFVVWANVSDAQSEILNVSAVVQQNSPATALWYHLMTYNGSFYQTTITLERANSTYSIWVEAFDSALNKASSHKLQFDLRTYLHTPVDPTITFPYVMTGSLITLTAVITFAYYYDKRMKRAEWS